MQLRLHLQLKRAYLLTGFIIEYLLILLHLGVKVTLLFWKAEGSGMSTLNLLDKLYQNAEITFCIIA